jgi:hypothetical protein
MSDVQGLESSADRPPPNGATYSPVFGRGAAQADGTKLPATRIAGHPHAAKHDQPRNEEDKVRRFHQAVAVAVGVGLASSAVADQVKVNIVYPINGAVYPITDPAPGVLRSMYFTSSFSVTCKGDHKVQWGFDGSPALGSSTFYDQTSVQFVHKLPGGGHVFWVKADCGENRVKFAIGR